MLRLLAIFAVFFLASCFSGKSGGGSGSAEKTHEVMITFVQNAQAGFWKEAMENVAPEEREEMMEGGQVLPEYKDAVNRIRLSTIKNMDLSLKKGRLIGLKDILDESNDFYRASDEKVVIDPDKLKDLSVERKKREKAEAEAQREDAEPAAAAEPELQEEDETTE